ncbi:hypothetical protein GCM10027081_38620 [Cupriavidus yeoncheonensis]
MVAMAALFSCSGKREPKDNPHLQSENASLSCGMHLPYDPTELQPPQPARPASRGSLPLEVSNRPVCVYPTLINPMAFLDAIEIRCKKT